MGQRKNFIFCLTGFTIVLMGTFNGQTLDRLAEKAEGYLATDFNASMIKQGMMLEYLCSDYLRRTSQIGNVNKRHRYATFEEMLDYLTQIKVIVAGSDTDRLCTSIRLNRNEATHGCKESETAAKTTLEPLRRFCQKILDSTNALSSPPATAEPKWTNPMTLREPEVAYGGRRESQPKAPPFVNAFETIADDFRLSDDELKAIGVGYFWSYQIDNME